MLSLENILKHFNFNSNFKFNFNFNRYHGSVAPKGSDLASLQLIMKEGDDPRPFIPIATTSSSTSESDGELELLDSDIAFLSNYLDTTYLDPIAIGKINNQFCDDSSVQLKNFLKSDIAEKIFRCTKTADSDDKLGISF